MTYYDILFSFFIYGFLGWCSEVAFAAFKQHSFVNRGFLVHRSCICDNKAEKVREQRFPEWSDLSDLWNWSDGCRCFSSALRRKLDLALYYLHHSRYFS